MRHYFRIFMAKISPSVLLAILMLTIPLSGCLEDSISEEILGDDASTVFVDPCTLPSQSLTQSFIDINVNGEDRQYRSLHQVRMWVRCCPSSLPSTVEAAVPRISNNRVSLTNLEKKRNSSWPMPLQMMIELQQKANGI